MVFESYFDMEFETITVRGEGASQLLTELSGPIKGMNKTRYAADGFSILAWERYDVWRTNSDIMVALIMDLTDSRTCEVAIMAGGGGDEILGWDWSFLSLVAGQVSDVEEGAEAAAIQDTVEYLGNRCEDLSLDIATE